MTTSLADTWAELIATALLGTDRRPLPPPPVGPAGEFGHGCRRRGRPAGPGRRRAGRRVGAGAVPEGPVRRYPVPADDRPPCLAPAARRLGRILGGDHPDLLDEWLRGPRPRPAAPRRRSTWSTWSTAPAPLPRFGRSWSTAAGPVAGWLAELLPGLGWDIGPPMDPRRPGSGVSRPSGSRRFAGCGPPIRPRPATCSPRACRGSGPSCGPRPTAPWPPASARRTSPPGARRSTIGRPRCASVAAELLAGCRRRRGRSAWPAGRARMVEIAGPAGHDRFEIALVAPVPPSWARDGIDAAAPAGTSLGVHVLRQVVAGSTLGGWEALAPLGAPHRAGRRARAGCGAARGLGHGRRPPARRRAGPVSWSARRPIPASCRAAGGRRGADRGATRDGRPGVDAARARRRSRRSRAVAGAGAAARWPRRSSALFAERRVGRHQAPLLRRLARALDPAVLRASRTSCRRAGPAAAARRRARRPGRPALVPGRHAGGAGPREATRRA